MNTLHTAIHKTLAFFDILNHPLTQEEVYQLLWSEGQKFSYTVVIHALDEMVVHNDLQCTEGMYHFPGREEIVSLRVARVYETERKMKIAVRATKLLRLLPFIRAVFLCNSVGFGTSDEDSDIDVLMIVKKHHIWVARFLSNALLKLFGLRTSGDHLKDKMCLSFIITDTRLNIHSIQFGEHDVYQTYWLMHLVPVYDSDDLHGSMMRANDWVKQVIHDVDHAYRASHRCRVEDSVWSLRIRLFLTKLFISTTREQQFKKLQFPRLEAVYGDVAKYADTRVIISDDMVKLHKNDRRGWFQAEWERKSA